MICDIVLEIGVKNGVDNKSFVISKADIEKSGLDVSSIDEIAKFIVESHKNNPNYIEKLFTALVGAYKRQNKDDKVFLEDNGKKHIIGNCNKQQLKNIWPEYFTGDTRFFDEGEYSITLMNGGKSAGYDLRGRQIIGGEPTYIIRHQYDLETFLKNERKKWEVKQRVINGVIVKADFNPETDIDEKGKIKKEAIDEYLTEKYGSILKKLVNHFKSKLKTVSVEDYVDGNPPTEYSIPLLIADYINNKNGSNEFAKEIKIGNSAINPASILRDFCTELVYGSIIAAEENEVIRDLKGISYDLKKFGKREFYDVLSKHGLTSNLSELEFINMSLDELQEFLDSTGKFGNFSVETVDKTEEGNAKLTQKQLNKLLESAFNLQIDGKKVTLDEFKNAAIADFSKVITVVQHVFNIDGTDFRVMLSVKNGKLVGDYKRKKLSNTDSIKLKRVNKTIHEKYGTTYSTMNIYVPINNDKYGIVNGKYRGFYIYKFTPNEGGPVKYLVSKSPIFPNLYNPFEFNDELSAILKVNSLADNENVFNAAAIDLKTMLNLGEPRRTVKVNTLISQGLVLESLDFPIPGKSTVSDKSRELMQTKTYSEIINYYNQFGIDISSLDSAEKVGIFVYAMDRINLSVENITKRANENFDLNLSDEEKENINKIINKINSAKTLQFLVERFYQNDDIRKAWLVHIPDGVVVNSGGMAAKGENEYAPITSVTASLENMREVINADLFGYSDKNPNGFHIEFKTQEELESLLTEDNLKLIPDATNVRGFVHGNTLYVKKGVLFTNERGSDIVHEVMHIVFGAIRVQDPEAYGKILLQVVGNAGYEGSDYNKVFGPKSEYKNLAQIDKLEEVAVRHLARLVDNSDIMYYQNHGDDLIEQIFKTFTGINAEVRKLLNQDSLLLAQTNGIGFATRLQAIINSKENLEKMKNNRLITNLIADAIESGKIIEDCD